MAYKFSLVRASDGKLRSGYYGFSWATLLFGPLPSILREDFGAPILIMAAEIAACIAAFFYYDHDVNLLAVRVLIVFASWAWVYNELHALALMSSGFRLNGSEDVVAALTPKYPGSDWAVRARLLKERSLLFVLVGICVVQLLLVYFPLLVAGGRHPGPDNPVVVVQPSARPAPAPAPVAPAPAPVASPPPVIQQAAPPPQPASPDVAKTGIDSPKITPAPVPASAVPVKSAAEIRLENQRQCDAAMGTQFDSDLPKNVIPVANTAKMSNLEIDEAISNCEAGRGGANRRFASQLGRAHAAKAVWLVAQGDEIQARQNMDRASELWEAAARQGSGAALNFLGALYRGSFNSPNVVFQQDYRKALDYWRQGASLGNPKAARNAGGLLLLGSPDYFPVNQDVRTAVKLLEQGIDGGDPAAAAVYGRALYLGDPKGVVRNPDRGLELLARACAAGESTAKDFYDSAIARQRQLLRPSGC